MPKTSTIITSQDAQHRDVRIVAHAMRGVLLQVTRRARGGRETTISCALTPDDCRELAAVCLTGHGATVNT